MPPKSILFVCVGNACRSQMAEGFARQLGNGNLSVYSAGTRALGYIIPETIQAMEEKGIDVTHQRSKWVSELPKIEFDLAVLMGCGDNCPTVRAKKRIEWKIPDPVGLPHEKFCRVRDTIEEKVRSLLSELEI